jgi:PAS domain S-box-containing protein
MAHEKTSISDAPPGRLPRLRRFTGLDEVREWLRTNCEDSACTCTAIDRDGTLIYASPAFGELVGIDCKTLIGSPPPYPWWPPELHTEISQQRRAVTTGLIQKLQIRTGATVVRDSEGQRFRCVVDGQILRDLDDGQLGALIRYHPRVTPEQRAEIPHASSSTGLEILSAREGEVLGHLLEGKDPVSIGVELCISPHTVRNHLKSIYRKLEVHSRTELFARLRQV